jgi:hypothetical protein
MTIERLREAHSARPFSPFVLHLADGRDLTVAHPESLAIAPSGRTVVVVQPDDSTQFVDLLLVTVLELWPSAGGTRRRRTS